MKRLVYLFYIALLIQCLFSCTAGTIKERELFFASLSISDVKATCVAKTTITVGDLHNPEKIEDAKYYMLLQGDNRYYYYLIYDENRNIVDEGGSYWRSPEISMINDSIVRIRTQAGTGVSTSSTFYYNAKKDVISRRFNSVYDQTDELIVFSHYRKLIVRDIFDKTVYYKEFSIFNAELADSVDPFIDAEFINSGKQIKVTYLSGATYAEGTEIINLY